MTTPITLSIRQEVLATTSAYVSVSEITGVSGLTGAAADDVAAAFEFDLNSSGAEIFTGVISPQSMYTVPVAPAFDLQLVADKFDLLTLPQVTQVRITLPAYWETEQYATIQHTGNSGELVLSGGAWQFTSATYNSFTATDVGSKIRLTSGSAGVYKITQVLSPTTVVIATNVALADATSLSWELLSFPTTGAATFSSTGLTTTLGLSLPAPLYAANTSTLTIDLLDASTTVQANIPAKPVRVTQDTRLRTDVFYEYSGTAAAAASRNVEVAALLKPYVTSLNTVQSFAGSHAVTSSIITGS